MCPESHIHSAMNTILCVVLPLILCGGWNLWNRKMLLMQWSIQNQKTTTMETLWLIVANFLEPIYTRGSAVVLDSGFCILKGIIELKKRGVYASALIKKCLYWPKYIKGNGIKSHFDDKDVGDCDA